MCLKAEYIEMLSLKNIKIIYIKAEFVLKNTKIIFKMSKSDFQINMTVKLKQ